MDEKPKQIITAGFVVLSGLFIFGTFACGQNQTIVQSKTNTENYTVFDDAFPSVTTINSEQCPKYIIYGTKEYRQQINANNISKENDSVMQYTVTQSRGYSQSTNAPKSTTEWSACICIKNTGTENIEITDATCTFTTGTRSLKKTNGSWDKLICPKIIEPGEDAYIQLSMRDDNDNKSLDGNTYEITDITIYGKTTEKTATGNIFGPIDFQQMAQDDETWTSATGWIQNENENEDPEMYVYMVGLKNGKFQKMYQTIAHDYSKSGHADFSFNNHTNEDYFINDVDECIFYSFVGDTYSQDVDEKNRSLSETADNKSEIIEQITN